MSTHQQDKQSSRTRRRRRPLRHNDLSTLTYLPVHLCQLTSFQTLTQVSCRRRRRRTSRRHLAASGPPCQTPSAASSPSGTAPESGGLQSAVCRPRTSCQLRSFFSSFVFKSPVARAHHRVGQACCRQFHCFSAICSAHQAREAVGNVELDVTHRMCIVLPANSVKSVNSNVHWTVGVWRVLYIWAQFLPDWLQYQACNTSNIVVAPIGSAGGLYTVM